RDGAFDLSAPRRPQPIRMPFDYLLWSLAKGFGERAVCIVLTGTGTDGSAGADAIKKTGGLVIAQDPQEAEYDGMPRSAVVTGAVDLILPLAKIPEALVQHVDRQHLGAAKT